MFLPSPNDITQRCGEKRQGRDDTNCTNVVTTHTYRQSLLKSFYSVAAGDRGSFVMNEKESLREKLADFITFTHPGSQLLQEVGVLVRLPVS